VKAMLVAAAVVCRETAMKSKLSAALAAFSIIGLASSLLMHDAIANPITIQLQEDGVNGGAITTVATGDGLANVAGLAYATFTSVSVTGLGYGARGIGWWRRRQRIA
jgi:hypothetical protein